MACLAGKGESLIKLHILSDLHLELAMYRPFKTDADVVILAGDIWKADRGIGWARSNWPESEIVYVPGNHEFYGSNRLETLAKMRIAARECGVRLLDNDEVVVSGVRFLGTTLWTDFQLFGEEKKVLAMSAGIEGMNDFRVIHEGGRHFSPEDANRLFNESVTWLENKLSRDRHDGKTVVVTHHLPSLMSVENRYKEDLLSACYASHLDHIIGLSDLWVHGHTHHNVDYQHGKARVVSNPRGYCSHYQETENRGFNPGLLVNL